MFRFIPYDLRNWFYREYLASDDLVDQVLENYIRTDPLEDSGEFCVWLFSAIPSNDPVWEYYLDPIMQNRRGDLLCGIDINPGLLTKKVVSHRCFDLLPNPVDYADADDDIYDASSSGDLELLIYLHPIMKHENYGRYFLEIAIDTHWAFMEWILEHHGLEDPTFYVLVCSAINNDRIDILQWVTSIGYKLDNRFYYYVAAASGSLESLRYLIENIGCRIFIHSSEDINTDTLEWILENDPHLTDEQRNNISLQILKGEMDYGTDSD